MLTEPAVRNEEEKFGVKVYHECEKLGSLQYDGPVPSYFLNEAFADISFQ